MTAGMEAGTDWRERIEPDEAERYEQAGRRFAQMQAIKSVRYGAGRALHRKPLAALGGRLVVGQGLPQWAAQGLFARPGEHEVWIRLSNGGFDHARDRIPDIRGFALKVFGVDGPSALGNGPARSQDFTLINQEAFAFSGSQEFIDFALAASKGHGALLMHVVRRYGLLALPGRLRDMARTVGRPFSGFATEAFHSALPMANGPYAVRVRLVPDAANGSAWPEASRDWGADVATRLAQRDLHWDLQLQPWVNEATTPIEDAAVVWPTPYLTVARLSVPRQDVNSEECQRLARRIEQGVIDPWQALAAHRPLGDVQRARRHVYHVSQKGRQADAEASPAA